MYFRKILLVLVLPSLVFAEEAPISSPEIYDTKTKTRTSWASIEERVKDADVIVFGEEHNDSKGHAWKLEALKRLSAKYPISLSLEMLERDQQRSVDEFARDEITEKGFLNSGKFWPNYQTDYHPLVMFAKENRIPILAANAPKKYVNLVSSKGIGALYKIRSPYLPPRYLYKMHRQKEYEELVLSAMSGHSVGMNFDPEKFLDSQYVWDASMSDAIANAFYANGRKVFQVNGRFHTDSGLGLTHRLRQYGLKVLVLSIFPGFEGENLTDKDWALGDFVILSERKPLP
ncbi:ChaN family lipoprotein [Leptospira wolffii]|uniref:ChaN family lipoprotein n=1 Tax=Leptospira wolffii TaxID=409998 RepID=UPI000318BEF6|nr:ChaN family lipoprotein [Leptospira wolffii]EPG66164.1 PF04187 family protein [Leptospira wolffii serovar Khorat str. Khorat-H2]